VREVSSTRNTSAQGLIGVCGAYGVGNLRDLQGQDCPAKTQRPSGYEPGYIHIDVKYLPQNVLMRAAARYLFSCNKTGPTRWVSFRRLTAKRRAANARRFLRDLERGMPIRIAPYSTDNGIGFQ